MLFQCKCLHTFGEQEVLVAVVEGGISRCRYLNGDEWTLVGEGESLEIQPLVAAGDIGRQGHLMVCDDDVAEYGLCLVAGQGLCSPSCIFSSVQQDFVFLNILQGGQISLDGVFCGGRDDRQRSCTIVSVKSVEHRFVYAIGKVGLRLLEFESLVQHLDVTVANGGLDIRPVGCRSIAQHVGIRKQRGCIDRNSQVVGSCQQQLSGSLAQFSHRRILVAIDGICLLEFRCIVSLFSCLKNGLLQFEQLFPFFVFGVIPIGDVARGDESPVGVTTSVACRQWSSVSVGKVEIGFLALGFKYVHDA